MSDSNSSSANKTRVFRIATRQSPLAMWQAEYVAAKLGEKSVKTAIVPLVSTGDVDMRPIDGTRQVGLFTKRIQQALVLDEADIAVHSLKDLPTEPDPRFQLAAVPPREVVNDCLVSRTAKSLEELVDGAHIGTGSRRRAAQLWRRRPDLKISPIRGNVQTRLGKLDSGEFDAIILAQAGLLRLGMGDEVPATPIELDDMLPAPGQGALGIEVRSDDPECAAVVQQLDDTPTHAAAFLERKILASLNGGCLAPIAAFANFHDGVASLKVRVMSHDGAEEITLELEHDYDSRDNVMDMAVSMAADASEDLIAQGARELIQETHQNMD